MVQQNQVGDVIVKWQFFCFVVLKPNTNYSRHRDKLTRTTCYLEFQGFYLQCNHAEQALRNVKTSQV